MENENQNNKQLIEDLIINLENETKIDIDYKDYNIGHYIQPMNYGENNYNQMPYIDSTLFDEVSNGIKTQKKNQYVINNDIENKTLYISPLENKSFLSRIYNALFSEPIIYSSILEIKKSKN
jgi:hypothetical protein